MVKTFQLGSAGAYGKSIKVTPTTTDNAANVDTCFEIDGSDTYKIQTQTVLPDISQFEVGIKIPNFSRIKVTIPKFE